MLLQSKPSVAFAACGRSVRPRRIASVVVNCQAKAAEPLQQAAAGLAAAAIFLAPGPSFAALPDGFKSPSTAGDPATSYEKIIEDRTGKESALPELTEAPKGTVSIKTTYEVKPLVPGAQDTAKAVVPVAPMAPAVSEPPAAAPAMAAAPKAAEEISPIRAAAIADAQKAGGSVEGAVDARAGGNNALVIGGALLGVVAVAAAALGGNNQQPEGIAPAAAAPPAAPAAEPTPAPEATEAASAVNGGGGGASASNPSSKME